MAKKNSNTKTNLTVNFHGNDIQLINHNGEPYVPVRQVVEGMGLEWKAQYRKLNSNRERFSLDKIVADTPKGKRVAVGMPLRKLPGWLMTINPQKVSNELKPVIIQYQKECDEVLWDHWNGKTAKEKPSLPKPNDNLPSLPSKKHTWMVTDSNTGAVLELVDIKGADDLRGQVKKYLPCHAVLAREAIMNDLDAVIYTMMEAQNKIRMQLNPLITILGMSEDKTADDLWEDRVKEAGNRLAKVVG